MGTTQLYNDNLRKLPNEYGGVSIMTKNEEICIRMDAILYLMCLDSITWSETLTNLNTISSTSMTECA